jgi:hypothetical protein
VQNGFDSFGVQQRDEKDKADGHDLHDGAYANAIPAWLPFREKFQARSNRFSANGAAPSLLVRGGTRTVGVEANSHGCLGWSI